MSKKKEQEKLKYYTIKDFCDQVDFTKLIIRKKEKSLYGKGKRFRDADEARDVLENR